MAADTGWIRPWQDLNSPNQPLQQVETPLPLGMMPSAHDPPAVARPHREERKLPPIPKAVYATLRASFSPESTTQQSPSHVASAVPPVSRSPATVDAQHLFQPDHRDAHDTSSLRRLSLPPLPYERGLGEHNNLSHLDHIPTQSPGQQHQQSEVQVEPKRHMSAADLPQITGLARSASDWSVGQTQRTINYDETPTAAESALYLQGTHSDKLRAVVEAILLELAVLDNKLDDAGSPLDWLIKPPDVGELGLQQSLDWALQSIRRVSRWCGSRCKWGATDTGDGTPRLYATASTPPSLPAGKRKVDGFEDKDESRKRTCPRLCDDRFDAFDRCRDYMKGICRRRSLMRDPPPPPLALCSHRVDSSDKPALMSPPSSTHLSSSARVLPTLSSLSFASYPDVEPNPLPSKDPSHAAQVAHLQDLQHQISTKTLALQTLQREHDNLLSAFSRSQIRCATLEKKFQVSDTEINSLTEERIKLLSQIEAFETQVEELTISREEARKQSVANGGQYMKIMAMASRLEAQGAADKKKWASEREAWDKEREGYCQEIQILRVEKEELIRAEKAPVTGLNSMPRSPNVPLPLPALGLSASSPKDSDIPDGPPSGEADDILMSTSLVTLRNEIVRLRDNCSVINVALQGVRTEGERMEQVMNLMGTIKQQITTKVDAGIRSCKLSGDSYPRAGGEEPAGNGAIQAELSSPSL